MSGSAQEQLLMQMLAAQGGQQPAYFGAPQRRVAPAARPAPPAFMAGLAPPISPELMLADMAIAADQRALDEESARRSPAAQPVTPPARPQERTNAAPQNPGEANWWDRMLEAGARNLVERGGASDRFGQLSGLPQPLADEFDRRNAEYAAMSADELRRRGRYPELPVEVTPPAQAEPPATAGSGTAGGTGGGGGAGVPTFAAFRGNDPDFAGVRAQYERGRPQQRERSEEERMLRIIAQGLAGAQGRTGVDVATGVVGGVAGGYARESDRDEALWQQDETARRQFELGLAGLLGQQEQAQFNNALARQTFDRQSALSGAELGLRREGLDIQREAAGDARMLRQLRMASLARQLGMASDPSQILARGVDALIRSPGAQIIVDGRPMTLDVDGTRMSLGQLRAAINSRRGDVQTRFMTNPQAYNDQIAGEISDRFMRGFMALQPGQQRQVLEQLGRLQETRPRSGSTRIDDE